MHRIGKEARAYQALYASCRLTPYNLWRMASVTSSVVDLPPRSGVLY
jgi:hypothetical protein